MQRSSTNGGGGGEGSVALRRLRTSLEESEWAQNLVGLCTYYIMLAFFESEAKALSIIRAF